MLTRGPEPLRNSHEARHAAADRIWGPVALGPFEGFVFGRGSELFPTPTSFMTRQVTLSLSFLVFKIGTIIAPWGVFVGIT